MGKPKENLNWITIPRKKSHVLESTEYGKVTRQEWCQYEAVRIGKKWCSYNEDDENCWIERNQLIG